MEWLVKAWPGVARQGLGSKRAPARCGHRRVPGTDRRRFRARHGSAGYGEARLGKARVVTKRLRLVVGYTKGAIPEERRGNRGIWPITWRKPAVLWAVFQQGEPEKKKADD